MAENSNRAALVPTVPTVPTRPMSGAASDVNTRLQHLRALLHSERHGNAEQRRAIETLDREMLEISAEPVSARLDRRRRGLEAQSAEHETDSLPEHLSSSNALLLMRRRRVVRPSDRLHRFRAMNPTESQTFTESMEETTATLDHPPPVEPTDIATQEYFGEAQINRENRWRAKRRKLDDGTFEEEAKTFSYGHKGQVVPGLLKLDIGSCDGGEYSEPHLGSSWPQHVLQDDSSVYCTKSDRCNMLLKHVGGMPFSLSKLVIKAPRTGYDAPIQEGMVFVSMNDHRLLERTSPYEIRYSPKKHRHHPRIEHNHIRYGFHTSREYLNAIRAPLRSLDRSSYLQDPYPPMESQNTANDGIGDPFDIKLIPGFEISTTYDNASDNEDASRVSPLARRLSASYHADPDRPTNMPLGFSDYYRPTYPDTDNDNGSVSSASSNRSETREPPENLDAILGRQRRLLRSMRMQQGHDAEFQNLPELRDEFSHAFRHMQAVESEHGSRRRTRPSRIEVRSEAEGHETLPIALAPEDSAGLSAPVSQKPLDVLAPHARFFIRRDKSSVSIKFDPPVAGRFILIKLWAPCPNANIDIQSIVAHGYGGPRFFPAYEPR